MRQGCTAVCSAARSSSAARMLRRGRSNSPFLHHRGWSFLLFDSMDGLFSWRRLSFLLTALVVLQSVFLFSFRERDDLAPTRPFAFPHHSEQLWTANATVSTGLQQAILTDGQCGLEYPDLFYEIERGIAYWKDRHHTISKKDVDIGWRENGAFKILIHENELRVLQTKGTHGDGHYRVRTLSTLHQIQQALWSATAAGEMLPTIEAAGVVDDMSMLGGVENGDTHSIWTFTSNVHDENHKRHWLVPDFNLYSSPASGSYQDQLRLAEQHDDLIIDKIQKIIWRGVVWTNPRIREALMNEAANKSWADVAVINWDTRENIIPMDEMCRYALTVHTEGRSYSGRLPFLLNCDSVTIIHDLDWTAHFYHLLIGSGENQNYLPVESDFSDLEKKVKHYLKNPKQAQKIVQNSIDTFRTKYLSPAATTCYFRRLIQGYAQVSFTPEVEREPESKTNIKRRGISFEEFVHLDRDYAGDE